MDHTAIIDRLGGIVPVAEATGRHRSRISFWRKHGIPAREWAKIVEVAKTLRVRGITLDLLAAGKPAGEVPNLPRGRRPSKQPAQATA